MYILSFLILHADDEWFNGRKPTSEVPAINLVLTIEAGIQVDMKCKEEDEDEAVASSPGYNNVVKASEAAAMTTKTDKKIKKTVRFSEPLIMKNSVRFADPIDDEAGVKEEEQGEQVNEEGHGAYKFLVLFGCPLPLTASLRYSVLGFNVFFLILWTFAGVQSLNIEAPVAASLLHVNYYTSSSTDEVKEAAMASNDVSERVLHFFS